MLALHGTGVSEGISLGKAHVLRRKRLDTREYVIPESLLEEEVTRFTRAIELARTQLEQVRIHIPAGAPAETASFIDTHLLILSDPMISEAPIDFIRTARRNAEWALKTQSEDLSRMFEGMEDPYLRARRVDVEQVVDRVLRNLLTPREQEHEELAAGDILVASDLSPADAVMLKHKHVNAFVTELGGPISHTAILARSLGIPAVVAVHNATRFLRNGDTLIIDGNRGLLIAGRDRKILAEYRRRKQDLRRAHEQLGRLRSGRSVTRDGRKVRLLANIELPADIRAANRVSASGIGLYRTEYLFMNRDSMPSEDEQYRAYTKVVKALAGKLVTIRTLDLVADKQVDGGSNSSRAINPALGLRAVRLCLHDVALFRPQLRAIFRASAHGKVRIMIPMLSSQEELHQVLDLIEETKAELKAQRIKFNPRTPIGGMIEVPAAAICADLFAPFLDFLSIGTNDLIQYTLAIDRMNDAVNYLYDPLHPSVLRLISGTIKAGKHAGIPVAMCGEMAGDSRYTRLLLGMGLTEFSMHPSTLLQIKKIVRTSSVTALQKFAQKALKTTDVSTLHNMVDEMNERYELL